MFAPVYISRAVTHINIQSIPLLGIVRRRSYRCRVVNCIRLNVCIAVTVYFPDFFRRSLACSCSSMSLFQNACTLSNSSCEGGSSCAPPSARRVSSGKATPSGSIPKYRPLLPRNPSNPISPISSLPFCIALVSADVKTVAWHSPQLSAPVPRSQLHPVDRRYIGDRLFPGPFPAFLLLVLGHHV